MSWFKVDDGFSTSKKVLSIPRTQRLAAVGLWTLAGNWSAKELTDGVVPKYVLDELGATPKLVQALIDARLWDDGRSTEARSRLDEASAEPRARLGQSVPCIVFRHWAKYQPTRAYVEEERRKTAERQATWREKKKGETRDEPVTNGDVTPLVTRESPVSHSAPTRPDPTRPLTTSDEVVEKPSSPAPPKTDEAFDAFWQRYPRKVGKDDAHKAYLRARKRASEGQILVGAHRLATDPNLPEKQYIPHPSKWLNGGQWDDEPLPARTGAPTQSTTGDRVRGALDRARELAEQESQGLLQIGGTA